MSVLAMILELIRFGLPVAQEVLDAADVELSLSRMVGEPTENEMKIRDAGLAAAHAALQAAQQAPAP